RELGLAREACERLLDRRQRGRVLDLERGLRRGLGARLVVPVDRGGEERDRRLAAELDPRVERGGADGLVVVRRERDELAGGLGVARRREPRDHGADDVLVLAAARELAEASRVAVLRRLAFAPDEVLAQRALGARGLERRGLVRLERDRL